MPCNIQYTDIIFTVTCVSFSHYSAGYFFAKKTPQNKFSREFEIVLNFSGEFTSGEFTSEELISLRTVKLFLLS